MSVANPDASATGDRNCDAGARTGSVKDGGYTRETMARRSDSQRECEAFLAANMGLLVRVASSYEAIPALREDLVQDIVLAVWQASKHFEGRASFKTFALRVAHNRAITHVGREARRPVGTEYEEVHAAPGGGPEDLLTRRQAQERLVRAIRRLPVSQRQVLSLALEGLSYEEIAEVVGITRNNVGVRLNRARNALKELLDE